MHFCADEAAALLTGVVFLRQGWTWLRVRIRELRQRGQAEPEQPLDNTCPPDKK